jgi:putative transposase
MITHKTWAAVGRCFTVLVGRKYRLELTADQAASVEDYAGICRSVWNTALEQRRMYRQSGAWINYVQQAAQMVEAKADFPWLADAPSHVLQQTLKDLDKACRAHGTFKVHWRSQRKWSPSMRFPQGQRIAVERLNRKHGRATSGSAPTRGWGASRGLGGAVKSATVSRDGRHWNISFLVETGEPEKTVSLERGRIGVDRGVVVAAATDQGDLYDRKFITPGEAERYLRLQRQLARSRKGSNRRKATVAAMGAVMQRVRHRRADFNAQTARTLVTANALVVLEDLNTKGMTKSAKGTVEQPGKRVAQKRGLNRAITDKGWHGLELALRSATRTTGTTIIKVNPAYTSQRCSACGFVTEGNRDSQAAFSCKAPGCGYREHADVNAARNIKAAGHGGFRTWRPRHQPVREAPTRPLGNQKATIPAMRREGIPAL